RVAVAGYDRVRLSVLPVDEAPVRSAEPHRVLDEAIEDRLEIEGRAADELENLAGGRLLGQRLGEVAVADLQFFEGPDVLDGDYGLVREGLEEGDLPVAEGPHLGTADVDGADGTTVFADQRHAQDRAVTHEPRVGASLREFVALGLHIGDMHGLSV